MWIIIVRQTLASRKCLLFNYDDHTWKINLLKLVHPSHESNMSRVELIIACLLLQFQVELAISQHQCKNHLTASFPSCNNNPVLRVTKSTEMYQVTLLATEWQCFNQFCLANDQNHRQRNITCSETCRACQQLKPQLGNVKNTEIHICIHARIGTYVALSLNFAQLGIGEPDLGVSSIVCYRIEVFKLKLYCHMCHCMQTAEQMLKFVKWMWIHI